MFDVEVKEWLYCTRSGVVRGGAELPALPLWDGGRSGSRAVSDEIAATNQGP